MRGLIESFSSFDRFLMVIFAAWILIAVISALGVLGKGIGSALKARRWSKQVRLFMRELPKPYAISEIHIEVKDDRRVVDVAYPLDDFDDDDDDDDALDRLADEDQNALTEHLARLATASFITYHYPDGSTRDYDADTGLVIGGMFAIGPDQFTYTQTKPVHDAPCQADATDGAVSPGQDAEAALAQTDLPGTHTHVTYDAKHKTLTAHTGGPEVTPDPVEDDTLAYTG